MGNEEIDFKQIMKNLQLKAEEDGKVTLEEEEFLYSLAKEVGEFQFVLNIAQQDKIISDDEFQNLIILRDSILNTAMNFESDSDDINQLVQQLFEEINRYQLPGMVDDELVDSEIDPVDDN